MPLHLFERIGWTKHLKGGEHSDLRGEFAAHLGNTELLIKRKDVEQQHQAEQTFKNGFQLRFADDGGPHVGIGFTDHADGKCDANDQDCRPSPPFGTLQASHFRLSFRESGVETCDVMSRR